MRFCHKLWQNCSWFPGAITASSLINAKAMMLPFICRNELATPYFVPGVVTFLLGSLLSVVFVLFVSYLYLWRRFAMSAAEFKRINGGIRGIAQASAQTQRIAIIFLKAFFAEKGALAPGRLRIALLWPMRTRPE